MKRIFFIATVVGVMPGVIALVLSFCSFPQAAWILDKVVHGNSDFGTVYKISGKGLFRHGLIIAFRLLENNTASIICIAAGLLLYLGGMYFFLFKR